MVYQAFTSVLSIISVCDKWQPVLKSKKYYCDEREKADLIQIAFSSLRRWTPFPQRCRSLHCFRRTRQRSLARNLQMDFKVTLYLLYGWTDVEILDDMWVTNIYWFKFLHGTILTREHNVSRQHAVVSQYDLNEKKNFDGTFKVVYNT